MLTRDEENLVRILARERDNTRRIWFYVAVLTAPVVMVLYGIVQGDYVAVAVAFFALFGLVLWSISRELKYAKHFRSICSKLISSRFIMSDEKNNV